MSLKITTLLAIHNQSQLLTQRLLSSFFNQTLLPDHLIVIDDSDNNHSFKVENVTSVIPRHIGFTYLKNTRTEGMSGAWNTGLAYVADNCCHNPKNMYITILSEQYKWTDNHIRSCVKYTSEKDMIISGIIRHDESGIHHRPIPDKLDINASLIGKSVIHPANIFLRLSSLLEAGLFDENLTTLIVDDLCIRLSEINVSTISTNCHTVHYYVDPEKEMLGIPEKKISVQTFFQKYHCRMTFSQKQTFQKHKRKNFGSSFTSENKPFVPIKTVKTYRSDPFHIIVGVISANATQLAYLLEDLCLIQSFPFIKGLEVLILHNGGDEQSLLSLSAKMIDNGLFCYFISQIQQEKDALNGSFGKPFKRNNKQLSIGKARTLLQRYLYEFVRKKTDSIVWILDDDMQLDARAEKYLACLPEFKKHGADILLGTFEGASPNPATSGMRVQLVDLLNNFEWLYSMKSGKSLPDRSEENRHLRMMYPDYYYDLSRLHTAHLETVYWLTPNFLGETVSESKNYLIRNLHTLFGGSSLLRPVIVELPADPIREAEDSVNRGGNTFIFNPLALKNTPNSVIEISGKETRRSDMLWAFINRYYYGLKIMRVNFPVIHNRSIFVETKLSMEKTIAEIQGSSIHAALKDLFGSCERQKFEFDDEMKTMMCEKVRQYSDKRLSSFRLSFFRIQGICKALEKFDQKGEIRNFLDTLSDFYVNKTLNTITNGVRELSDDHVENFLDSLKTQIDSYALSELDITFLYEQKSEISN